MKRRLAVVALALLGTACQGPPRTADPFRYTRIPPPGTNQIGVIGQPPSTYDPSLMQPPTVTVPPSAGDPYHTPGAWGSPAAAPAAVPGVVVPPTGGAIAPGGATTPTNSPGYPSQLNQRGPPRRRSLEDSSGAVVQASYSKVIRSTTAKPKSSSQATTDAVDDSRSVVTTGKPARFPGADEAIDIMDLPRAPRRSAMRLAGSPQSDDADRVVRKPPADDYYGHDPSYNRLRGKLERSLISGQWKLRYIPIDGETDAHGGSVVLGGPLPSNFNPGDLVEVQGQLSGESQGGGFAPAYQVTAIRAQAS